MFQMTDGIQYQADMPISLKPHVLLQKLKQYFHFSTFKSDLQKNAIIEILKRKYIISS